MQPFEPRTGYYNILTTRVRRHNVLAGARGSRAACRSHTLILLQRKSWGDTRSATNRVCNLNFVWLQHSPVIGTTDDPFVVETNAAHQLLVTLQHPQTRTALYVP